MASPVCALALAVAGAVLVVPGARARAGAAGDVGVAIVRRDGRLQPLASLAGDTWTPLAAAAATGPWQVWLFDDPAVKASPFTMRSARAATATAAAGPCLPVAGLESGILTGPGPAAGAAPPIALALRGTEARPDVPVTLAAVGDLGSEFAAKAGAAFHRAEDEVLTLETEQLPSGFPRFAVRRERPITWTLIARQGVALGATRTFYLEGRKDYEGFRGRTDIGRIRTTGFVFMQVHGDRAAIDAEVDLSDVDGSQSLFRTPIAAVSLPARAVWLFAARGPDGAHLEIVELPPGAAGPRSVWQGPDGCDGEP